MAKQFLSILTLGCALLGLPKKAAAQIITSEVKVEQRSNTEIKTDLLVDGSVVTQGNQTVSGVLNVSGDIYGGYNKNFYMPGFTASWAGRPYCGFSTDYDAGSDQNFAKIVHWGLGRGGFRFYAHVNYNDTSPTFVAEISRFGAVSGASDRRLKENIHRVEGAREKIRKLEAVSYNWINDQDKTPTAGFIAQEVYEQIPEAVSKQATQQRWHVDHANQPNSSLSG